MNRGIINAGKRVKRGTNNREAGFRSSISQRCVPPHNQHALGDVAKMLDAWGILLQRKITELRAMIANRPCQSKLQLAPDDHFSSHTSNPIIWQPMQEALIGLPPIPRTMDGNRIVLPHEYSRALDRFLGKDVTWLIVPCATNVLATLPRVLLPTFVQLKEKEIATAYKVSLRNIKAFVEEEARIFDIRDKNRVNVPARSLQFLCFEKNETTLILSASEAWIEISPLSHFRKVRRQRVSELSNILIDSRSAVFTEFVRPVPPLPVSTKRDL